MDQDLLAAVAVPPVPRKAPACSVAIERFVDDLEVRARFLPETKGADITLKQVSDLLSRAADKGIDYLKIETLYTFDGKNGFSSSQGE